MKSLLTVLVMLFFGQAGMAWAACAAAAADVRFGAVHIDPSAPVGTELRTVPAVAEYHCDSAELKSPDGERSGDVVFQLWPNGRDTNQDFVYATGVEGVGVRLRERSGRFYVVKPGGGRLQHAVNSFCWRRMTNGHDDEGCAVLPESQCRPNHRGLGCRIFFTATLVKVGEVKGGRLDSEYGDLSAYSPGVIGGKKLNKMRIIGTVASRARCTIGDLNVDLGRVSVNTLVAEGSAAARHFNVSLSGCEPKQQVALVFSTFTPVGADCDGLIANGVAGTATGVGVKVSREGGDPVCWNRAVRHRVDPGGGITVPMRAAITRLTSAPGAGTVVGSMVVQATYP